MIYSNTQYRLLMHLQWLNHSFTIVLNVKLILAPFTSFDLDKRCSQLVCVAPFITSKLPCSNNMDIVSPVLLCLKANFLSAPRLIEAIAPSLANVFSSSLCHAIASSPL